MVLSQCLPCKYEDFNWIPRTLMQRPMQQNMSVNPELKRHRRKDPWGLLTSQISRIGEVQVQ